MKQIPLTQGKVALVDDGDFEQLNQYKWRATKLGHTYYAFRHTYLTNGKRVDVGMHRDILGLKYDDGIESDHRDHNGLNNQRYNLRICTHSENQYNRKRSWGSSKFKGVTWRQKDKKWQAGILCKPKFYYLGLFNDETEAAKAYDQKARELFGEFACVNFPDIHDKLESAARQAAQQTGNISKRNKK